jgi:hypothetical protein
MRSPASPNLRDLEIAGALLTGDDAAHAAMRTLVMQREIPG